MKPHVYGIFHVPQKLFGSGRFSRQGAIRACFYDAKRAAKISAKTVRDGRTLSFWSLSECQITHLPVRERVNADFLAGVRFFEGPNIERGFPCRSLV